MQTQEEQYIVAMRHHNVNSLFVVNLIMHALYTYTVYFYRVVVLASVAIM